MAPEGNIQQKSVNLRESFLNQAKNFPVVLKSINLRVRVNCLSIDKYSFVISNSVGLVMYA